MLGRSNNKIQPSLYIPDYWFVETLVMPIELKFSYG
jgi:hypothetical protein